jgi:hypothetical protein
MYQKYILSILSFAHVLQIPNGWTGNTFGVSRVYPVNWTPKVVSLQFPPSLKILPAVRKSYSAPENGKRSTFPGAHEF